MTYEERQAIQHIQELEFFINLIGFTGLSFLFLKFLALMENQGLFNIPEKQRAPIIKQIILPLIPFAASFGDRRNIIVGLAIYSLSLSGLAKSEWRLWLILALSLAPLLLLLNNTHYLPLESLFQAISLLAALFGTLISLRIHIEEHFLHSGNQDGKQN